MALLFNTVEKGGVLDMKKLMMGILLPGILFVAGCHQVIPKRFLPNDPGYYSLLIISKQQIAPNGYEKWEQQNDITNVDAINGRPSAKNFKALDIKKTPAFVVFDVHGVVFKTYNEKQLIKFLHQHNPS